MNGGKEVGLNVSPLENGGFEKKLFTRS